MATISTISKRPSLFMVLVLAIVTTASVTCWSLS